MIIPYFLFNRHVSADLLPSLQLQHAILAFEQGNSYCLGHVLQRPWWDVFHRSMDSIVPSERVELAFPSKYEKNEENIQGGSRIIVPIFIFVCVVKRWNPLKDGKKTVFHRKE